MSATGLSTAEIVININKRKSRSRSQNNKPPSWIFESEGQGTGHLVDAGVPLRAREGRALRNGGCSDWPAGLDFSMCQLSTPSHGPWTVPASLEEVCTWRR